jgi:L-ascorbate metabolism protein UlaG (beta-lactamase superfamily)
VLDVSACRFEVTFLGHQSWALDAGRGLVLVDPLLEDGMGDGLVPYLAVYPPRRLDAARMPPVAAVVLTHEHPDHFHLPSLARIPRTVPIFLSSNASGAARTALRELGFAVHAFRAGETVRVAGLELHPQRPLGRTRPDEWDVIPFLARDEGRNGSFFTTVDLSFDPSTARALARLEPRPILWAVPNNDMDLSDLYTFSPPSADRSAQRAQAWGAQLDELASTWGMPDAALLYGGGFSFPGDLAWLNTRAFDCDGDAAIAAMPPGQAERFASVLPGDSFAMVGGSLVVRRRVDWIVLPPPSSWPPRGASAVPRPAVDPFSRGRAPAPLAPDERRALDDALAGLAAALYGGELFAGLLGLVASEIAPAAPTVAFLVHDLVDPGDLAVRVYDPTSATFSAAGEPRTDAWAACCECFARDLLDGLTLAQSPGYTIFGRMRFHARAGCERLDLDMALYLYTHPLRAPARFLEIYRRQLAALGPRAPDLPAR